MKDELAVAFGNELERSMKECQISLVELSLRSKIRLTTLSHYKNGDRLPSYKNLFKICGAFPFLAFRLIHLPMFLRYEEVTDE